MRIPVSIFAMLAAWVRDMARRPGQRPSPKLDVVCPEVTTMVDARTNEPPLVPLFGVRYLAFALTEGGEGCARRLVGLCHARWGGCFAEIQRFVSEAK